MKHYFSTDTARRLASQLGVDPDDYAAAIGPLVEDLEISDRVTVFADALHERLPGEFPVAVGGIVEKLGPELEEGEGYFNNAFHLWPVSRYIERYGLEHPEVSLDAIEALTRRFTGEWAVRPFLREYPEMTMERVLEWAESPSHNVRRLASEGIRPRLPWAPVHTPFTVDPSPILPILERLYRDPSKYVRTSVANNLNDISRTHPALALETSQRWHADSPWVAERALRTLVKRGDPDALRILGMEPGGIDILAVDFPTAARIGEAAELTVTLANTTDRPQQVLADYRVHFRKANGQLRPSVFRLGKTELAPGERRTRVKRHVFRVTGTRTYYPGAQAVSVVVNGAGSAILPFELTA